MTRFSIRRKRARTPAAQLRLRGPTSPSSPTAARSWSRTCPAPMWASRRANSLFVCERLPHAAGGFLQAFRQYAGFADDTHEVGVGDPPRQHVHVNVSCNAGPGGFPNIHSKVDSIRPVELAEHALHALGEAHHLLGRLSREQVEPVEVPIGDDHRMSTGIGVAVK